MWRVTLLLVGEEVEGEDWAAVFPWDTASGAPNLVLERRRG
jgi:hypothetical protein